MKSIKIKALITATVILSSYTIHRAKTDSKEFSSMTLMNIEALADDNETNGEKRFKYDTWYNEDCYIYVGGAYAKGKKVSCRDGTTIQYALTANCKLCFLCTK